MILRTAESFGSLTREPAQRMGTVRQGARIHFLPCGVVGSRMRHPVHLHHPLGAHPGIHLGGGNRSVAQKLLHHPNIGPALQQVCSKRMPH